jgi:glycosyltransferase involved in cell wall biosynthesis
VVVEAEPFVSVIIPVYNDRDRLLQCLEALQTQSYSHFEIIVVTNGNSQDMGQPLPHVRYYHEPKQGSYAARNCGITHAQGSIIACTDSDCISSPDWLAHGVRSLQAHPSAGIVGGGIRFFFKRPNRPTPAEYADSLSYLRQQAYVEQEHYAAGASFFTRKVVLEQVGGFDERLLNLGDKEFGQRVYASGWQVVYCEAAYVWHPARDFRGLIQKAQRQTLANYTLCQLRGERWQFSARQFLPLGLNFWRGVLGDTNLKDWREKLGFVAVIHCVKWAIALQACRFFIFFVPLWRLGARKITLLR